MRPAALLLLSLLAGGVWWALGNGPALDGAGVPRFALLYFSAALIYLLALVLARQIQAPAVGSHPDDPVLAPLRDDTYAKVNHPQIPGIYGPLLEVVFALLALIGGVTAFKVAFVLADLGLSLLVLRSLGRARASPLWFVVYAWHPLLILEVAGQCHLEIVPVALLALAVDLEQRGRTRLAPLALGCAIAAKYLPVLVVPAFLFGVRGWRERAGRLGLIALPCALFFLPYLLAGGGPGTALGAYGSTWRFNDGGFFAIDAALRGSGLSQAFCRSILPAFVEVPLGFDPAEHQTWMLILPKAVVGVVVVVIMGWVSWPREGRVDVERAAFAAGALFLAFSPTVHPWYALWLLPFLPARASSGRASTAGWLTLTLVLPMAYAVKVGPWREITWTRPLIYLPVIALLAFGWAREKTASTESHPR
jgi:hypothetical protein